MSCHILSYHIISYHSIAYHIISYQSIAYHLISHHITSHHCYFLSIISAASVAWSCRWVVAAVVAAQLAATTVCPEPMAGCLWWASGGNSWKTRRGRLLRCCVLGFESLRIELPWNRSESRVTAHVPLLLFRKNRHHELRIGFRLLHTLSLDVWSRKWSRTLQILAWWRCSEAGFSWCHWCANMLIEMC